ncbi:MAG: ECF-type sigma factor [Pseudomonadota bacterium]
MDHARATITRILSDADNAGDAAERLFPVLYAELHRIGAGLLQGERRGYTLSTTELVHEAYLRLFDSGANAWTNRRHFFGAAATAMRRILVDRARAKAAKKRIPKDKLADLEQTVVASADPPISQVIEIDAALERLAKLDPRRVQVVELRYFVGLTESEIAEVMELSRATVAREWRGARRWLLAELSRQ